MLISLGCVIVCLISILIVWLILFLIAMAEYVIFHSSSIVKTTFSKLKTLTSKSSTSNYKNVFLSCNLLLLSLLLLAIKRISVWNPDIRLSNKVANENLTKTYTPIIYSITGRIFEEFELTENGFGKTKRHASQNSRWSRLRTNWHWHQT